MDIDTDIDLDIHLDIDLDIDVDKGSLRSFSQNWTRERSVHTRLLHLYTRSLLTVYKVSFNCILSLCPAYVVRP